MRRRLDLARSDAVSPRKVAILGGGMAALTTAWRLTTNINFRCCTDINDCRLCFLNNSREIRQCDVLRMRVLCVYDPS